MKKALTLFIAIVHTMMAWSADGSPFTANVNGVTMNFQVISETDKTCQVGVWNWDAGSHSGSGKLAVLPSTSGSITIPKTVSGYTVTKIGYHAFSTCCYITSVSIPQTVTVIDGKAFEECSRLSSISIPNGVISIGDYAFDGCSGLTSVTIPATVTSIGDYAFSYCSGLLDISVESKNTVYDSRENCNAIIKTAENKLIAGCKNTVIPKTVTSIGAAAFVGCSGLTSIIIPALVTSIEDNAFDGCESLTSVTLPNSVTSIGVSAFRYCSGLTAITIPNSVTSIGYFAFQYCKNLTSVVSRINNPFAFSTTAFGDISNECVLTVPYGTRDAYIAAGWTEDIFKGGIVETAPNTITFADPAVEAICIANWDSNKDGKLTIAEAAAANSLGSVFKYKKNITSFTELQYFTGLTSIGESAFDGCSSLTSIEIPNSVTSIGNSAFEDCSGLTSVTIPNSVTSIGENAFYWCSNLTSVNISDLGAWCNISFGNVYANPLNYAHRLFLNGVEVTDLVIPNSVTSIGNVAFFGCSGLTSVTIPNSVTSIGNCVFYGCSGLTSIEIPNSVTSIDYSAFYGCSGLTSIEIPNSVTSIGNAVFRGCSGLTSVTIPNSVTSIGDYAFSGCSGLTSVTIPNSVTSIGDYAFSGCSGLTSVTIPNSVTSIGDYAFYECSGLTNVTIPNSVTSIGEQAFSGCYGLMSVAIPNSVTNISYGTFYGCSGLTSVTIPNSVTSIGQSAFSGCSGLTNVTIPNSVTSIGQSAFSGCSGLTNVTIPNSVTSIGQSAFSGCSGLTSVTIPNSVTSIGNYAFYKCSGLTSVKVDVVNPLSIDYQTFSNRANATLYVPVGSKAAYEAADYWKQFKEIIEFIEGDVNGDGESDVLDVVDIARYVVGTPAETFVPILADINNNGEVNIADAVSLANDIAGDQNFAKPNRAPKHNAANETLLLTTDNENYLSLALQNERDYTAFQFDLYVPDGTDVTQMLLNAQRKQKHQLLYNKVEDGHWRVAALSTSNRTFNGNDGELLSVVYDGIMNDEVAIRNILFFTADGSDYQFDDISLSGTTAIHSLNNGQGANVGSSTVYDMQGRKIMSGDSSNRQLPKGLYIINGKKVVIK